MSFQIKKMETIVADMVTWLAGVQKKVTDFTVGGKVRTKLEAVAVEIESYYFQVYQAIKKAIPTAIYAAFGFPLLSAGRASGLVTFTASPAPATDIGIPAGTQVSVAATSTVPEKIYQTTVSATLLAGQTTVDVQVLCTVAGDTGNTAANSITTLKTSIPGITSVANAAAFSNGAAQEQESDRAIRFQEHIDALSRGTAAAIEYGAKQAVLTDDAGTVLERVVAAKVIEPSPPTGSINCYIYNGTGSASASLIAAAQKIVDGYEDSSGNIIEGYSAAGITCVVASVATTILNTTCELTVKSGTDSATVIAKAQSVISEYIKSLKVGQTFIYNEIVERLMGIDGVVDVDVTVPASNQTPAASSVYLPGTATATVAP